MHRISTKVFLSPNGRRDMQDEWDRTVPANLGADAINVIGFNSKGRYSEAVEKRFMKKYGEDMPYPKSYSADMYDLGVDHYEVWTRKNKIIDHKKTEVSVRRKFKSKPETVTKGGELKEIHRYAVIADYRDYDPLEHGGEDMMSFVKGNYLFNHNGKPPVRIEYVEPARRKQIDKNEEISR